VDIGWRAAALDAVLRMDGKRALACSPGIKRRLSQIDEILKMKCDKICHSSFLMKFDEK